VMSSAVMSTLFPYTTLFRSVAVIEEESDRLDSLVSETIRMARIEAGDLHLERRPQGAADLIKTAVQKLRILLEDRDIRVETDPRSEEHTSELQSRFDLVCRL